MAKVKNISGGTLLLVLRDDDNNKLQEEVANNGIVTVPDKLFNDSDDVQRLVDAGKIEIVESTEAGKERIFATSDDIDFAASASEDIEVDVNSVVQTIVKGRIYVDEDPGAAFDESTVISIHNHSDRADNQLLQSFTHDLAYDELSAAPSATDTTVDVDDGSVFTAGELILIGGTNPEYRRIASISTNELTLVDALEYDHAIDDGVSLVYELNSVSTMNLEGEDKINFRVAFGSSQTVSLKLDLWVQQQ